jgi:hypothetical protein
LHLDENGAHGGIVRLRKREARDDVSSGRPVPPQQLGDGLSVSFRLFQTHNVGPGIPNGICDHPQVGRAAVRLWVAPRSVRQIQTRAAVEEIERHHRNASTASQSNAKHKQNHFRNKHQKKTNKKNTKQKRTRQKLLHVSL